MENNNEFYEKNKCFIETETEKQELELSDKIFDNIVRAGFENNFEEGVKYIKIYIENPNIYHSWGLDERNLRKELCYCFCLDKDKDNDNCFTFRYNKLKCNCVRGKRFRVINFFKILNFTDTKLYKFLYENIFKSYNYNIIDNKTNELDNKTNELDNKTKELDNYNEEIKKLYMQIKEEVINLQKKIYDVNTLIIQVKTIDLNYNVYYEDIDTLTFDFKKYDKLEKLNYIKLNSNYSNIEDSKKILNLINAFKVAKILNGTRHFLLSNEEWQKYWKQRLNIK